MSAARVTPQRGGDGSAAAAKARRRAVVQARHYAGRLVGWSFEVARTPPPGISTGPMSLSRGQNRPVVLVVLLQAEVEAVAATAAAIAEHARSGGPRAVLLLDRGHFAAARRAGVVADHVLSQEAWSRRHDPAQWPAYLEAEITSLARDLRADRVVRLPPQGWAAPGEAVPGAVSAGSAALGSVSNGAAARSPIDPPPVGAIARAWRRVVVRLERRVDRGVN